jgi:pimeloyl-ACP methyl ester carboxylesterase
MQILLNDKAAYWYAGSSGKLPLADPTKPALLLLHGAAHDHSVWTLLARYFAHHGYAVIAPDLPGHGRSSGPVLDSIPAMAQWSEQLLTTLGIKRFVAIGHSMGSLISVELARQLLTQSNASIQLDALGLLSTAVPMTVSDTLLNLVRSDPEKAMQQINHWSCSTVSATPGNPGPGFSTYMQNLRLMQRQGAAVLLNDFLACNAYHDGTAALTEISAKQLPVALLTGRQDQMTPAKAAIACSAQSGQRTSLHLLPDCGHALLAEQPHEVLHILVNWLKTSATSALPMPIGANRQSTLGSS